MGVNSTRGNSRNCSTNENGTRTVVLVGRTGNGKSATGNSMLGRKAFKSRASSSGVTTKTELQSVRFHENGNVINVIDTPAGLFGLSDGSEALRGNEIHGCIELARDGIHAFLFVLSVNTRFWKEEEEALQRMQAVFGPSITDYMILVFTGGDQLRDNEENIDDYLGHDCPEPLQKILKACEGRYAVFDNKSKEKKQKAEQVRSVVEIINDIVAKNNGPYIYIESKQQKGKEPSHGQEQDDSNSEGDSTIEQVTEVEKRIDRSLETQITEVVVQKEAKKPSRDQEQDDSSAQEEVVDQVELKVIEPKLKETTQRPIQKLVAKERTAKDKGTARAAQQKARKKEAKHDEEKLDSAGVEVADQVEGQVINETTQKPKQKLAAKKGAVKSKGTTQAAQLKSRGNAEKIGPEEQIGSSSIGDADGGEVLDVDRQVEKSFEERLKRITDTTESLQIASVDTTESVEPIVGKEEEISTAASRNEVWPQPVRRTARLRRPPAYLDDYEWKRHGY